MRKLCLVLLGLALLVQNPSVRADDGLPGDIPLDDILQLIPATFGGPLMVEKVWTYDSGVGEGGAEIVAYDTKSRRLFVTNAETERIDVLDAADGSKIGELDPSGAPNSVAAHNGLIAVATEGATSQDNGHVAFFDGHTLTAVDLVPAGALPDMVTFTPDGKYALVANEGEPNDDYSVDPEGSITIIEIGKRRGAYTFSARTAGFTGFNGDKAALMASGVRIFGPGSDTDGLATVAQDLEPEYIAVDSKSRVAVVSCQENNAFAFVDIKGARVLKIAPLGFKDYNAPGNGIDASDRDDAINIQNWPVYGMYQPDAIASFRLFGREFIIATNEGDARDYDTFSEEDRIKDLDLDPTAFPDAASLQEDENIGRLEVTNTLGDTDGDGDFDELYSYGARSFTIWTVDRSGSLTLVFDSGDQFEQITAAQIPEGFNSTNDEQDSADSRSDAKGPEPEAVDVGRVGGRMYAFIGLERVGGVMIYEITDPTAPKFELYVNNRDFAAEDVEDAGDLGPECVEFIPAGRSPLIRPAFAVANEISGTTSLYVLRRDSLLDLLIDQILAGLLLGADE
ncbi:MAG: choice-of-anchor I family protein [Maioricimonas sp. JB045]|uniref:choice-of-anchor I family protein n=1 Tax=Maioricimonas sp. JC845 TaxID=3232138 RepID=UPI00345AB184